jgi:hypothetical protein
MCNKIVTLSRKRVRTGTDCHVQLFSVCLLFLLLIFHFGFAMDFFHCSLSGFLQETQLSAAITHYHEVYEVSDRWSYYSRF